MSVEVEISLLAWTSVALVGMDWPVSPRVFNVDGNHQNTLNSTLVIIYYGANLRTMMLFQLHGLLLLNQPVNFKRGEMKSAATFPFPLFVREVPMAASFRSRVR